MASAEAEVMGTTIPLQDSKPALNEDRPTSPMPSTSSTSDAETESEFDNDDDEDAPPSTTTTFVAPAGEKHTHTLIFLHGREDFGQYMAEDFLNYKSASGQTFPELFPTMKFVFPTAKLRYCAQRDEEFKNSSFADALKGEEIISQWFDMWWTNGTDEKQDLMVDGLRESVPQIMEIIMEEAKNVPLDHIVLGGMSQGCATALATLLSSPGLKLGGLIGWCGFLPFQSTILESPSKDIGSQIQEILRNPQVKDSQQDPDDLTTSLDNVSINKSRAGTVRTPILLAHSQDDDIVSLKRGTGMRDTLDKFGASVAWKEYVDGGHQVHPTKGVDDISEFLRQMLKI